jgi:hypothetical protein
MDLVFQYSRPPITREDLAAFESRHGIRLPREVVDLLLEHNGGNFGFDYPCYRIHGHPRQHEGLLQCFFALAPGDPIDIERNYKVHKGRLPDELLAIASDPGNNLICIGLKGEHTGKIYFWERTKEEDKPTFNNVFLLANSLSEFINNLYPS